MTDHQAKLHWIRRKWQAYPDRTTVEAAFPKSTKIAERWKVILRWFPFMNMIAIKHTQYVATKEMESW